MAYSKQEREDIFNTIFDLIESGKSLRFALSKIPLSSKSFYEWIEEDADKVKQYARALDERTELKFESIEMDYMEEPQRDPETGKIDSAWVALQRLKIDSKKWELGKLKPKKYGDKLHHSGDKDNPIIIQSSKEFTPEQKERLEKLKEKLDNSL